MDGLAVPSKVQVPMVDLVWRPDPKPEDPDEEDFLPDAPGSFVVGWFPIVPAEPLEEGQTFPEKAEIYIRLQISELLLPKEELEVTPPPPLTSRACCCLAVSPHAPAQRGRVASTVQYPLTCVCVCVCVCGMGRQSLNVLTMTVESMHRLPAVWGPEPEGQGEDHPYVYKLRYKLPGSGTGDGASIDVAIQPGEIVAKQPEPGAGGGEGGEEKAVDAAEGAFEAEEGEEPAVKRVESAVGFSKVKKP